MDRLFILDSNSILYRAFFALPKLTTKKGELVNGVYGFLLLLFKIIREFRPEYLVACFDFPAKTLRHKEFEDYKKNRPKMPDELISQIPKLKEVLNSFSIPIFEKEGFEADDLIGTISEISPKEIEKIIVTGDLDNLQLVSEKTKVYFLKKGLKTPLILDKEKVKEKYFGLEPEQIPDFKALVGDPSDNIPGIEGIGPKTAAKLLFRYKSIKRMIEEIEKDKEIEPKLKEKILENKEKIALNLKLAKIKRDVEIDFDIERSRFKSFNQEKVKESLEKLGFKSLIKRLDELTIGGKNLKLF